MKKIQLHSAEYYKSFFPFLNWFARKNISYHFQFIEYLYYIKREEEPVLTTRSLLNKTFIIEMFSISECILDNLVTSLVVETRDGSFRNLYVKEYTSFSDLIELAQYYKIISADIAEEVKLLSKRRNAIHIKRPGEKYEYEAYDDSVLIQNEKIFSDLLKHLWRVYTVSYVDFAWPDPNFTK